MEDVLSPVERIWKRRAEERRALAIERTLATFDAMRNAGLSVKVTGSLVRGDFGASSDVDLLVEGQWSDVVKAHKIAEQQMLGFPFDVIPVQLLAPEAIQISQEGALNEIDFRRRFGEPRET
jgi:predicted nucleotidyltransferase